MISNRGRKMVGEPSPLVTAHFKCKEDPFSITDNPDGKINFGTAENHLMDREMITRLEKPQHFTSEELHYGHLHGTDTFRVSIAAFMEENLGISDVTPDNIVVASGASAILESLSMGLFEDGDGLIVPTPFYTGFIHDFSTRFNVNIIQLDLLPDTRFNLDPDDVEALIKRCLKNNRKVKCILVCSPQNPLGITYSDTTLRSLIKIARKYDLDIISDEIYARSVYSGSFKSLLEIGKDYREHIHFVYGFAKDFVLSGFKTGVFYSENKDLVDVIKEISYFHTVSNHTQKFIGDFLKDQPFCRAFIQKNNKRLLESYTHIETLLKQDLNIDIIPANAGIFIWADFSKFLTEKTFEAELKLFDDIFNQCNVSISPGQYFNCCTPGWFRICFAQKKDVITHAVERLLRHLR